MQFSYRTEEIMLLGTNEPTGSRGPPEINVRWVAIEIELSLAKLHKSDCP